MIHNLTWWQYLIIGSVGAAIWLALAYTVAILFGQICRLRDPDDPQ